MEHLRWKGPNEARVHGKNKTKEATMRMMSMNRMMGVMLVATLGMGCGDSGNNNNNGTCANAAGTWSITGACGTDTCIVTQVGCATNFACGGGAAAYTGTVSGNSISYSGHDPSGAAGSCQATIAGTTASGTCNQKSGTCTFSATMGTTPTCANVAGTWTVTGTCGPADTCIVTQTGCNTSFACGGGAVAYTGTVSGNALTYSGKSATGAPSTCTGTVNGNTFAGTCTSGGTTCSITASH
jgi:hypothetical protein